MIYSKVKAGVWVKYIGSMLSELDNGEMLP